MNKFIISLTIFLLFVTNIVIAQESCLLGTVIDKKTKETLIGANIFVTKNPIQGTVTNLDGEFKLALDSGVYNISVSYISYKTKIFSDIEISSNSKKELLIELDGVNLGIDAVVVTAKARQKTENALQILQKLSPKVVDGISTEQIGKLNDSNAAQALKRIPGVSVQAGKYVFVRGLSGRYTKVTFNGGEIPTVDFEKNTVQLDIFPSNIIESIIVSKTYMSDMPGDASGGLVDIVTKDFPEKFSLVFSSSFSYNKQANLNQNFLSYEGGKTDWLGIDDGTRDIPGIAQDALNEMGNKNYNQINQVYFPIQKLNEITKSFSTQMDVEKQNSFLNNSQKISLGDKVKFLNKTLGYNLALNYSHSYNFYNNGVFGEYEDATVVPKRLLNETKGDENSNIAAFINLSYKFNNNNIYKLRYFHNQSSKKQARYREGYFNYEDSYDQDRSLVFIERMFDNIQLLGEHSFKKLNNSKIKWQSSYAFMKQNEPDLRFFENLYDINGADTSFRTKTNDKPARYYRDISEINVSNRIDFEMPINFDLLKFKLQLGLSADFKNRDLNDVKFELFSPSTTIPNGDIVGYLKNDVISEDNYLGYFYSSDNYRNLNNSQSAYLRVLAGYIMFNFNLNDKCRLVSGFRVDKSILHTEDKLPLNHILKDDVTKDYLNILPSLNLSYSLKENMNFRFVYSKTLARPSFKEIGPSYYNFRNSELITGNLNLKISTINNVDLRWEYFFKQGEKISFSGFYKYFNKPIEKKLAVDVNNREFVYTNSEPIQLYGIELEFRKKLDFIVLLKDFILGGNFSLFKSEYKIPVEELASLRIGNPDRENTRPMQGQAPYIINSYLNYNNKRYKFDINVGFNVSGEKLVLITQNGTPYGYELARPALNCNLSKDIGNRLTVNFSIKNILDSEYAIVHHFNFEDRYYSKYTKGRLYAISFKMKINK